MPHCTTAGGAIPTAGRVPWPLELLQSACFLTDWPWSFSASLPCPAVLLGLCAGLRSAHSKPSGILSPNLSLTDGWMLGSLLVWSSSLEKPQVQPSKSINKLISKYCCLLSRTGTPGQTDFKSTTDGHRACWEPGHPFWVEFSKPLFLPGLETRLGAGQAGSSKGWRLL